MSCFNSFSQIIEAVQFDEGKSPCQIFKACTINLTSTSVSSISIITSFQPISAISKPTALPRMDELPAEGIRVPYFIFSNLKTSFCVIFRPRIFSAFFLNFPIFLRASIISHFLICSRCFFLASPSVNPQKISSQALQLTL